MAREGKSDAPSTDREGRIAQPHTPGRRLYDACAKAFDYLRPWSAGSAERKAQYERAAKLFVKSDPLLASAPELLEALKATEAHLAEYVALIGELTVAPRTVALLATVRGAIAKAEGR